MINLEVFLGNDGNCYECFFVYLWIYLLHLLLFFVVYYSVVIPLYWGQGKYPILFITYLSLLSVALILALTHSH
jgi:hypothetical protein